MVPGGYTQISMTSAVVTSQFDILRQTKSQYHLVNNRSLFSRFRQEMKRNVKDT